MVIALAFFKRTFTRSLPMNQTHGLIIAEVYGTCCVSTNTTFAYLGSFVSVVNEPGQSTPASASLWR